VVSFIPPIEASTTLFISSIVSPYLPMASLCFDWCILPPVIGSAYKSFTPEVPSRLFIFFEIKHW
jgi:hypothetical protein